MNPDDMIWLPAQDDGERVWLYEQVRKLEEEAASELELVLDELVFRLEQRLIPSILSNFPQDTPTATILAEVQDAISLSLREICGPALKNSCHDKVRNRLDLIHRSQAYRAYQGGLEDDPRAVALPGKAFEKTIKVRTVKRRPTQPNQQYFPPQSVTHKRKDAYLKK